MDIFKQYKTDNKKECNGIKLEYGINSNGKMQTFYIARSTKQNPKFQKAAENATKPYTRLIQTGHLSEDQALEINLSIFINAVLLGWDNILGEDGKELPYNKENAKQLMTKLPDLYNDLEKQSNDMSLFLTEEQEVQAKN